MSTESMGYELALPLVTLNREVRGGCGGCTDWASPSQHFTNTITLINLLCLGGGFRVLGVL